MRMFFVLVLGGAAAMLAAEPVQAGAPGSADRQAALRNVCQTGPLLGEACDPTELDPCGLDATGEPIACEVDFPAVPTLRGTLTMISDETVTDNSLFLGNPTITMLLELRAGQQSFRIAKTFQGPLFGVFPEVGLWFPPFSEDEIDLLPTSFSFQRPEGALDPVGLALVEVANRAFGERVSPSALPVIARLVPMPGTAAVDQYASADVAQVARFRIQIKFVEPSPHL